MDITLSTLIATEIVIFLLLTICVLTFLLKHEREKTAAFNKTRVNAKKFQFSDGKPTLELMQERLLKEIARLEHAYEKHNNPAGNSEGAEKILGILQVRKNFLQTEYNIIKALSEGAPYWITVQEEIKLFVELLPHNLFNNTNHQLNISEFNIAAIDQNFSSVAGEHFELSRSAIASAQLSSFQEKELETMAKAFEILQGQNLRLRTEVEIGKERVRVLEQNLEFISESEDSSDTQLTAAHIADDLRQLTSQDDDDSTNESLFQSTIKVLQTQVNRSQFELKLQTNKLREIQEAHQIEIR